MSGGVRHCPDSAPPDPQLDPDDSERVLTAAPQPKPEQLPVSISAEILPVPFAGCPELPGLRIQLLMTAAPLPRNYQDSEKMREPSNFWL